MGYRRSIYKKGRTFWQIKIYHQDFFPRTLCRTILFHTPQSEKEMFLSSRMEGRHRYREGGGRNTALYAQIGLEVPFGSSGTRILGTQSAKKIFLIIEKKCIEARTSEKRNWDGTTLQNSDSIPLLPILLRLLQKLRPEGAYMQYALLCSSSFPFKAPLTRSLLSSPVPPSVQSATHIARASFPTFLPISERANIIAKRGGEGERWRGGGGRDHISLFVLAGEGVQHSLSPGRKGESGVVTA